MATGKLRISQECKGFCQFCRSYWSVAAFIQNDYKCPDCSHQFKLFSDVCTCDQYGKWLTPCTTERAKDEILKGNAEWDDSGLLVVLDTPWRRRSIRKKVLQRDSHKCCWCGGPANSVDHIIPDSKNGPFIVENLMAACKECNEERRNAPVLEHLKYVVNAGRKSNVGLIKSRYAHAVIVVKGLHEKAHHNLLKFQQWASGNQEEKQI